MSDKAKDKADSGETSDKASKSATTSKNKQTKSTTKEKNVAQNGRQSAVNAAAIPHTTTTGGTAMPSASGESNSQRARTGVKAPHTISKPPADDNVHSRLDKFECFLESQAKNNQRFQSMVMQAMTMPEYDYGTMDDYDEGASFCSDSSSMQHDPELNNALAFMNMINEQGDGEANAPPADMHNALPAADNDNNNANGHDGAQAAQPVVDGDRPNADEQQQHVPPGFAARFAAQPDTGPPIDEAVAGSLNFLIHNSIEDATLTELYDRYNCPNNAKNLIVQKVNPTIWETIGGKARSQDLKLQRIQKPLVKGITALTRAVQNTELGTQHQDSLALLANATFELICLRKEMLKPVLNAKYAHLCKPSVKPTDLLFGDLSKMVKELDEAHKASAGLVAYKPRYGSNRFGAMRGRKSRFNPYPNMGRRGAFGQGQNPFLGYGRGTLSFRQGMKRAQQSWQNLNQQTRQQKRAQMGSQTHTKPNQK